MAKPKNRPDLDEVVLGVIVEQLGVDEGEVTPDADIANDLGADSLDVIELVMAFEAEFEIEIHDRDVATIKTVGQLQTYLAGRLGL